MKEYTLGTVKGFKLGAFGSGNSENMMRTIPGLRFFNNYRTDGPVAADYAVGSKTNTFTVSRDVTHPATYFDANGVMQVTTTSDTARRTAGYYDATGWHYAPGWLMEGASTNLHKYTAFDSNFSWSGANLQYSGTNAWMWGGTGTATASMSTSSPMSYAAKLAISNGGSTSKAVVFTSNSSNNYVSITSGSNYTVSFLIRTSVAVTIPLVVLDNSDDTTTRGLDTTFTTVANKWIEVSKTFTATADDTVRFWFYLGNLGAFDFEICGIQVENQLYPSSFIPTTTAALSRNAELPTYTTAGNFPAPSGGNCLSFDGASASGDDYVTLAASASDFIGTGDITVHLKAFRRSTGEGDYGILISNGMFRISCAGSAYAVYSDGSTAASSATTVTNNTWIDIFVTRTSAGVTNIYFNNSQSGTADQSSGTPTTASSDLVLGNNSAGTRTFDGFIKQVEVWGKILDSTERTTVYGGGRVTSSLSAEYLFTDGTGSTLTDSSGNSRSGTISGATWSKDTYSGSIMIKYRPVMLPVESTNLYLFKLQFVNYANTIIVTNRTSGDANVNFVTYSNLSSYQALPANNYCLGWNRYASHTLIATWSTTPFVVPALNSGNPIKMALFIDGVAAGYNTLLAVPAGAPSASFSIQPTAGQAMILEELAVWDRVLSATEMADATRYGGL